LHMVAVCLFIYLVTMIHRAEIIKHIVCVIWGFILWFPHVSLAQGSGQSIKFNGVNQSLDLGQKNLDSFRTIEMWFKPDEQIDVSNTEPRTLIARDFNTGDGRSINEFSVSFAPIIWGSPGQIRFVRWANRQKGDIVSDNNVWQKGRWYHLAATIDPKKGMRMYVNGVLQKQTDPTTAPIMPQSGSASDDVSIGKWGSIDVRFFHGEIDEVRIWETVRTQREIRDNMCSRIKNSGNGLEWYLPFDAGSTATFPGQFKPLMEAAYKNYSSNSRVVSGAPVGSVSIHNYPGSWLAKSLELVTDSTRAEVSNITSQASGLHIYADDQPNSMTGLSNWRSGEYFGVFFTDVQAEYSISFEAQTGCFCKVGARNDNASSSWQELSPIREECKLVLMDESSLDEPYRSEYIPNKTPRSPQVKKIAFCEGDSVVLYANISSDSYLWSNDSTSATIEVWQEGIYWVKTLKNTCYIADTFHVQILENGGVDLGGIRYICEDSTLLLRVADTSVFSIKWTFNGKIDSSRSFEVDTAGVVYLRALGKCGEFFDSVYIHQKNGRWLDTIICKDEVYEATARPDAMRNEWEDGTTDIKRTIAEQGTYWVRSDYPDCAITDTFQVTTYQNDRKLSFVSDMFELCKDSSLSLLIEGKDSIDVLWEFNGREYRNRPGLRVNEPGVLIATLMDRCDTTVREIDIVGVQCICSVELPNVFSPNADEKNAIFQPEYECEFTTYHFIIYNRWGQCVYETFSENNAWDGLLNGRECPSSTYFWILTYTSTVNDVPVERVGAVQLLR